MFNRSDVKKFIQNSNTELFKKLQEASNYKTLEELEKEFYGKENKIYKTMDDTITKGLHKNINKYSASTSDFNIPISTIVMFKLYSISGINAFIKMVKTYSEDYNLEILKSNFLYDHRSFQSKELNKCLDSLSTIPSLINQKMSDQRYAYNVKIDFYKNEEKYLNDILKSYYNIDEIVIEIKFTSKFKLNELFEEHQEHDNKNNNYNDNIFFRFF